MKPLRCIFRFHRLNCIGNETSEGAIQGGDSCNGDFNLYREITTSSRYQCMDCRFIQESTSTSFTTLDENENEEYHREQI